MKLIQLSERIFQIPLSGVNAYLVNDPDQLVLIDTGNPGDGPKLFQAIDAIGRDPADLSYILLTHFHIDHIGAAQDLQHSTKAKVLCHELDAAETRVGNSFRLDYEFAPGVLNRWLFNLLIKPQAKKKIPLPTIDETIQGDERLNIAGGIQALHTPGHTIGHLSFLFPEEKVLIAGDIALNVFRLGWMPFYEDFSAAKSSIKKLGTYKFDKIGFGHGKVIQDAARTKLLKRFT